MALWVDVIKGRKLLLLTLFTAALGTDVLFQVNLSQLFVTSYSYLVIPAGLLWKNYDAMTWCQFTQELNNILTCIGNRFAKNNLHTPDRPCMRLRCTCMCMHVAEKFLTSKQYTHLQCRGISTNWCARHSLVPESSRRHWTESVTNNNPLLHIGFAHNAIYEMKNLSPACVYS